MSLRFADDVDGLAGEGKELVNLVEQLDITSAAYGLAISAETIKLMINNTCGINTDIQVSDMKPRTSNSFKYLG